MSIQPASKHVYSVGDKVTMARGRVGHGCVLTVRYVSPDKKSVHVSSDGSEFEKLSYIKGTSGYYPFSSWALEPLWKHGIEYTEINRSTDKT